MDMYKIAVVPGDGIGQEVIPEAVRVLEATGLAFDFHHVDIGYYVYKTCGNPVPETSIEEIKENDVCLFGATTTPLGIPNYSSAILTLRKALDTYANIRPAKSIPVENSRENVDLIVVRENTEGIYIGVEYASQDMAFTVRVITRNASERIARKAFDIASMRRKKVTLVTKANIMRKTCGLFREACLFISKDYPDIELDELFIDVAAMHLVMKPESFDVIVTTNLFGDILSDEAAGLVGGLGLAPSANIGDRYALFEPVHGSAPDIVGKKIANPMAAIRSASLMLNHLGEPAWGARIEESVLDVLTDGRILTPDLGGSARTLDVTDEIIRRLMG